MGHPDLLWPPNWHPVHTRLVWEIEERRAHAPQVSSQHLREIQSQIVIYDDCFPPGDVAPMGN